MSTYLVDKYYGEDYGLEEEEEEGAAEGLHSREALEERIRSVRQQFSDIRQQAAVRAR